MGKPQIELISNVMKDLVYFLQFSFDSVTSGDVNSGWIVDVEGNSCLHRLEDVKKE